MPDEPYSKREMDEFKKDVFERLDRIEVQTTKHNGRMTKLEMWVYTAIGALTMLSVFAVPIIVEYLKDNLCC